MERRGPVDKVTTAEPTNTNKDKIKYLKRYILLDREIERKIREAEHWRSRLGNMTAQYSTQPKGGGSIYPKEEVIIAKIVDLENEIDADIDRLITIRDGIKAAIDAVEDDRERLLLQYRYLDGRTFEWIASEMNFHWQWIHRLHKKALKKLEINVCREMYS